MIVRSYPNLNPLWGQGAGAEESNICGCRVIDCWPAHIQALACDLETKSIHKGERVDRMHSFCIVLCHSWLCAPPPRPCHMLFSFPYQLHAWPWLLQYRRECVHIQAYRMSMSILFLHPLIFCGFWFFSFLSFEAGFPCVAALAVLEIAL